MECTLQTRTAAHAHPVTRLPRTEQVMETASGIEKCYAKVNIHNQTSDFAYWQTQSYQVRLATLEQIWQEYHRWRYSAEPELERVYTIVKR